MRLDTPPIRRFARRLGRPAPFVALAILLASPAVLARQAATAEDLARQAAIAAAMESVPLQIGNWIGSEVPIPTDQTEILNPNAILSRSYREIGSPGAGAGRMVGTDVTMLLIHCSDVRDMDGHWPLHCYPKSGWKVDATDEVLVPSPEGGSLRFIRAAFTIANNNASLRSMTVLFTFVLPEGRIEPDMRRVSDRSTRKSDSAKGVAQFQFVFSGDVPAERCAAVASDLIAGVPASLRSRLGVPLTAAAGSGAQSNDSMDGKENGHAEPQR